MTWNQLESAKLEEHLGDQFFFRMDKKVFYVKQVDNPGPLFQGLYTFLITTSSVLNSDSKSRNDIL
jgi:hypothetical protein